MQKDIHRWCYLKIKDGLDSDQKCSAFPKQSYQTESKCFIMILKIKVIGGGMPETSKIHSVH